MCADRHRRHCRSPPVAGRGTLPQEPASVIRCACTARQRRDSSDDASSIAPGSSRPGRGRAGGGQRGHLRLVAPRPGRVPDRPWHPAPGSRPLARRARRAVRARRGRSGLAAPILRDFADRLALSGHVLAYLDGDGWMLTIDGDRRVVELVEEINFCPGANWAEDSAGTNGPGTALAAGKPVEVFASEHFVAALQRWSCAAAPVRAPGEATPVGLVDITGPWEVQRRQAILVAKAVARAVEERLRAAVTIRDEVVKYAFRAAHDSGDALVAVDARGQVDRGERRRAPAQDPRGGSAAAVDPRRAHRRASRRSPAPAASSTSSRRTDRRSSPLPWSTTGRGSAPSSASPLPRRVAQRAPPGRGPAPPRGTTWAGSWAVARRSSAPLDLAQTAARNELAVILSRRVRDREGALRARDPLRERAPRGGVRRRELRLDPGAARRERSCSGTRRGRSRAPGARGTPASSRTPTAARSSSTR